MEKLFAYCSVLVLLIVLCFSGTASADLDPEVAESYNGHSHGFGTFTDEETLTMVSATYNSIAVKSGIGGMDYAYARLKWYNIPHLVYLSFSYNSIRDPVSNYDSCKITCGVQGGGGPPLTIIYPGNSSGHISKAYNVYSYNNIVVEAWAWGGSVAISNIRVSPSPDPRPVPKMPVAALGLLLH